MFSVVSGISGGSLLTALYAYSPKEFAEFDRMTTNLPRSGRQAALIRRALTPSATIRNRWHLGNYL